MAPRPSPVVGARRTAPLWRLVVAVWAAGQLLFLPARLVLFGAFRRGLGAIPDGFEPPPGDVLLLLRDELPAAAPALRWSLLLGALGWWLWTVLWHGGAVTASVWGGSPRLGELLGLGVVRYGRYLRLSLLAAAVTFVAFVAVWMPATSLVSSAYTEMADDRIIPVLLGALALTALLLLLVAAATLRAAWLLARPDRGSAVASWFAALAATARSPLASVGTVVVWLLLWLVLAVVPFALAGVLEPLRTGLAAPILEQLLALARAGCLVALLMSFAPTSGLLAERGRPDA